MVAVWVTAVLFILRPLHIKFKSLPLARSTFSGGTDPRTLERFPVQRVCATRIPPTTLCRRPEQRILSSFFFTGKTKQWKQATSLNGRPYVVGHVRRGLRGQIRGSPSRHDSSTKVISLGRDGPVKRDVNYFDAVSSRSLASTVQPPALTVGPGNEPYSPLRRHLLSFIYGSQGKYNPSPRYPDNAK